jgi:hypothetical protein
MSEIFAPGSVAGPAGPPVNFRGAYSSGTSYAAGDAVSQGGSSYISLVTANTGNTPASSPAQWAVLAAEGAAGSLTSVTTLASSVLPALSGNLFDVSKVTPNYTLNADGTLTAAANWNTSGLIYCAGMTSMVANLSITLFNASLVTYDANGNVIGTISQSTLGAAYNAGDNRMNGGIAWPLPGTQVYVRFAYVVPWMGTDGNAATDSLGMVYANTGTAALPASFVKFGYDTPSDVDSKVQSLAVLTPAAIAQFAANATPGAPALSQRNTFDYTKVLAGYSLHSDGTLAANSGWNVVTIYCPLATSFITNIGFLIYGPDYCVCTYDAAGNFIADITSTFTGFTSSGRITPNILCPLPGNQAYVKLTYADTGSLTAFGGDPLAGSKYNGVFYAGTTASPPPGTLTSLNRSTPFVGNTSPTVMRASALGASTDMTKDSTDVLNSFLATASSSNPIKLILDGMFQTQGLVLSSAGYTTIEGIGAGSGVYMIDNSPQDCIRIGAYTAATGASEGAYNITLPARSARNIVLRDFIIQPNTLSGQNGQTNASANQPVSGAAAHGTLGIILANCTDVLIDNITYLEPSQNYCLCLSNVGYVKVINSRFTTTGIGHDGIHIDGPAEDIGIENCDFATGDDAIALNAPEGYGGDISRVTVTNCRFNGSLSILRAYSSIDPAAFPTNNVHRIRNVAVSNCVGVASNICFVFGIFGGGFSSTADVDQIQDFTVSNCTFASPNSFAQIQNTVGAMTFRGVKYIPQSNAAVIFSNYSIGELTLDDFAILRNPVGNSAPNGLLSSNGSSAIDRLTLRHVRVIDEEGSSYTAVPYLLDLAGTVAALRMDEIDLAHVTALMSSFGFTNVTTIRGAGVLNCGAQMPDSVMDNNTLYLSSSASGAVSIKVGGTAKRVNLT